MPYGIDIFSHYQKSGSKFKIRFERRIYIPLPDVQARRFLLENNLTKNKNLLTPQNLEEIAVASEGYWFCPKTDLIIFSFSGSDMSNLVKDAVYGPVRKCQAATHFARINDNGQQKFVPVIDRDLNKWHPSQLIQKVLTELNGEDLKVPDVDMVIFLFKNSMN